MSRTDYRLSCLILIVLVQLSVNTLVVAAPATPSIGSVDATQTRSSNIKYSTPGDSRRKVQIYIERSHNGIDWSHPSNEFPYYKSLRTTQTSSITFTLPKGSLQGNYFYRTRARQWPSGQFHNASSWSSWHKFFVEGSSNKPTPPYPMSPSGSMSPKGIILRADNSSLPAPGFNNVQFWHDYEIKTAHNPFNAALDTVSLWKQSVPAGNGNSTEIKLQTCEGIRECNDGVLPESIGYSFRWRVRSVHDGMSSDWSRWRYFSTADKSDETWYIENRAGSYQAGKASGDEASGLVASNQYPGIYWFIRDAGELEDRRKIYAIRIDPTTRRLGNVDGYATKEITVRGANNTDWESISVDDSGNLWIADIGDYYRKAGQSGKRWNRNNSSEPDVRLYRVKEPNPEFDDSVTVTKDAPFRYPDGQTYNAEATFWMDGRMYLITKNENGSQSIYRFPTYISRTQSDNTLRFVGTLLDGLEPITDASITQDNSRIVLTTATKRALVFTAPPSNTNSSSAADAVVRNLLDSKRPKWEYYYRSAGALSADGELESERPGYAPTAQEVLTTMQIEGAAWDTSQQNLAMISEFGKHVLFVPSTSSSIDAAWKTRPFDTVSGANAGEIRKGNVCVDIPGADAGNGNDLWVSSCNDTATQVWSYDFVSGKIRAVNKPNKCLDVEGPFPGDNVAVQVWDCSDVPQHQWSVTARGQILSWDGRCLTSGAGDQDKVVLMGCGWDLGEPPSGQSWKVSAAAKTRLCTGAYFHSINIEHITKDGQDTVVFKARATQDAKETAWRRWNHDNLWDQFQSCLGPNLGHRISRDVRDVDWGYLYDQVICHALGEKTPLADSIGEYWDIEVENNPAQIDFCNDVRLFW